MRRGCSTLVPKQSNRLLRSMRLKASKISEVLFGDGKDKERRIHEFNTDDDSDKSSDDNGSDKDDDLMNEEERREWRKKIRDVLDMKLDVKEENDPIERKKKTEKLLVDYPLVVDEEDPDWPDDADGQGFNWSQFFNKITIKNVRKDDDDYDSDKELVWQDDDYIRPIKDITTKEWEETTFKDFSPLIVLVHNRYKRPKENEMLHDELVKAVQIFWDCRLPSPRVSHFVTSVTASIGDQTHIRDNGVSSHVTPVLFQQCVAVDAVVEHDLVSVLEVKIFPEVIFTKAGKILYRDKEIRTADELSKIMAFFYYGGAKPPCLDKYNGDNLKPIPSIA
ncbi:hypothetical protein ACLOJK_007672 [Asimina triloba]